MSDPDSVPDGNYWNILEFAGDSIPASSVSNALDIDGNGTGINVLAGDHYDGWEGYCADISGGTLTFEIDLPAGTFDIDPGFSIGSSTATITGDSFTGITGPTTVYLSFLNNGYPVTTATSIVISGEITVSATNQVNVQLTSLTDPDAVPDGNYWNVLGFAGDSIPAPSVSDALNTDGNRTYISVLAEDHYDGWEGYCADISGGTLTFEIDLPCGTFDIDPGFSIGSSTATITGDNFTGITGPTTVYLSFLNNGYPVTTATSIVINQY